MKENQEVVCSKKGEIGEGTDLDPIREIGQVHFLSDDVIIELDHLKIFTRKDLADFADYVLKNDHENFTYYELYLGWRTKTPPLKKHQKNLQHGNKK
jgi:hypothetical protein